MGKRIVADAGQCAGCFVCMLRCSYRFEKTYNLSKSRIKIERLVGQPNEFEIILTDGCDACGLCVTYCPYEALGQIEKHT